MKKAYRKPLLIVERFTLSQTIAHNCGDNLDFGMANYATKETCGWKIAEGMIIFMDDKNCTHLTEYFAGICYNAPAGGQSVFNS